MLSDCNGSLCVLDKRSCFGICPLHCARGKSLESAPVPWIFWYSNPPSGVSGSYSKHSGRYLTDVAASAAQNHSDIFQQTDKPLIDFFCKECRRFF